MMKKVTAWLLMLTLSLTVLTACAGQSAEKGTPDSGNAGSNDVVDKENDLSETPEEEEVTVRIAGLKGPTTMGLVKLMEDNEQGVSVNRYNFSVMGTADEITPLLNKGELDLAAIPANLASVLYNNTKGAIQVLAVNNLGVIYLVEKGEEISGFSDLVGKTVYATGKGTTPEYALRYLLTQNGIDPDTDVTLDFRSEATEVVAALDAAESGIAMLPQPYVTVAQTTIEGLTVALDLNEEWNKLDNGSSLVTGVVVARREFVEQYPQTVERFLAEYEASAAYANEQVEDAAALVEKYGIVKAAVAQKALPYCHISFMKGEQMKQAVSGYLAILGEQNSKAIGGELPGDDFYYMGR